MFCLVMFLHRLFGAREPSTTPDYPTCPNNFHLNIYHTTWIFRRYFSFFFSREFDRVYEPWRVQCKPTTQLVLLYTVQVDMDWWNTIPFHQKKNGFYIWKKKTDFSLIFPFMDLEILDLARWVDSECHLAFLCEWTEWGKIYSVSKRLWTPHLCDV